MHKFIYFIGKYIGKHIECIYIYIYTVLFEHGSKDEFVFSYAFLVDFRFTFSPEVLGPGPWS